MQEVDQGIGFIMGVYAYYPYTYIYILAMGSFPFIHHVHPYCSSRYQMDGEKVDEAEWSESLDEEDVTCSLNGLALLDHAMHWGRFSNF